MSAAFFTMCEANKENRPFSFSAILEGKVKFMRRREYKVNLLQMFPPGGAKLGKKDQQYILWSSEPISNHYFTRK